MKYFLLFFLLISSTASFSGTIDPNTSPEKYIDYGTKFKYIAKIICINTTNDIYTGSCVLIDDHHILTAAHIVESSELCCIKTDDKTYVLSKVFIPIEYTSEFGVADIALGYSDQVFGLDFYPSLYESDDELDKVCCISGFGFTGTFVTGAKDSDGKRRAGSNYIDKIEKDILICSPSRRKDKHFTSLEFFIANGDSGGGLFIDNKLAGINSCVIATNRSPDSKYDEESGHTRISKFFTWIEKNKIK